MKGGDSISGKRKSIIRDVISFFAYFNSLQIPAFAANASFFMILAVFPILMLLLSFIKLTPYTEADFIAMVNELSPEILKPLLITVSDELYESLSGAFLGITGLTAVWSASRSMLGLITGLNTVYRTDDTRNYFIKRFIAVIYMILFLAALVLLLLFHVFWSYITAMIQNYITFSLPFLVTLLRYAVVFVLLTLLFMLIFKVFPDRKAGFRAQFPGAVTAALGWMVFTGLYSFYVSNFSNFSYTYGSLAAIVLAMLWMYFGMMILFIGAAINAFLEKKQAGLTDIDEP